VDSWEVEGPPYSGERYHIGKNRGRLDFYVTTKDSTSTIHQWYYTKDPSLWDRYFNLRSMPKIKRVAHNTYWNP
jgi:hypothetical protein